VNHNRLASAVILGALALIVIYYATSMTGDKVPDVPQIDSEAQFYGLNISGDLSYNPGTPLDMRPEVHFHDTDCEPKIGQEYVRSRHSYPTVPGGNVSSIIHKGWGGFLESCPDNDWFFNPPEAAVL
jgi:hypothetical protein